MKRKLFLFFSGLCLAVIGFSQGADRRVLSNAGGESRTSSILLEWTLGEPIVSTVFSADKIFTQGFNQPVLTVKDKTPINVQAEIKGINIGIAPNPVQSILTVRVVAKANTTVDMYLSAADGKKVFHKNLYGMDVTTYISMSSLASGLYLLHIYSTKGLIKTFEIIKN